MVRDIVATLKLKSCRRLFGRVLTVSETHTLQASLTGTLGRALSATVIPAIVARARTDLRAALHDAHWAAAADAIGKVRVAVMRRGFLEIDIT